MAMCTEPLIKCFVERTKENLQNYQGNFEITQLINSMLGLLVFPAQKYFPNNATKEYKQHILNLLNEYEISLDKLPQSTRKIDLYEYIRKLRNGIAHAHIELLSNSGDEIDQLKIWNINDSGSKDFEVIFDFKPMDSMKKLIENFSNFLENIFIYELFDNVSCFDFKYKSNKRIIAIYDKNYECCSFEFIDNNLKCLTNCKTKSDNGCKYFLDTRILQKIIEIIGNQFNSINYSSTCKINKYEIEKIFWKELEKKGLAKKIDDSYQTNLNTQGQN